MVLIFSIILLIASVLFVNPCVLGAEYPSFLCAPQFGSAYVHLSSNAFYKLYSLDFGFLSLVELHGSYFYFLLAIFLIGAYLISAFERSALLLATFLFIFGSDGLLIQGVVLIPLILYAIKKENFFLLLLLSSLHAFIAGPVALLGVVALAFAIKPKAREIYALLTPAVVSVLFFSPPAFPAYPVFGRVLSAVYPPLEPWFGPSPQIWILDKSLVWDLFFIPSLLGMLLSVVTLRGRIAKVTSLIFIATLLDCFTFPPDRFGELAPVAVITRILPGFSFLPVTHIVFALGIILLVVYSSRRAAPLLLSALLTILFISLGRPLLYIESHDILESNSLIQRALQTPSGSMIRNNKFIQDRLRDGSWATKFKYRSLKKFNHTLSASSNPQLLKEINTKDLSRRWTPGGGSQKPGQWIGVYLESPVTLAGFQLDPGSFHSDFPVSLKVYWSKTCQDAPQSKEIMEKSREIHFDEQVFFLKSGIPYFQSPSDGKFVLSQPITGQCFIFEQTGMSTRYDWSINKIRLADKN